ncbi:MAG: RNA 2',3'-cyclic phosphodiesterase [Bacillota bacterium]|nr:RNA 2',3'-cyclic phosphodiesterase [Bacillota bacterium]
MEKQTHFFFALKLPDSTKQLLKEQCERLQGALPFQRWVHHEDFHITLAFLGFAPSSQLEAAINNVKETIPGFGSLDLKINRLGIFGKQDSPRIFFADTEVSNELQLIRHRVYTACIGAGFKLETRPFHPHITLARKWAGEKPFQREMLDLWKKLQPEPIAFKGIEIALYQTHLDKSPKYEAVRLFSLDNTQ